MAKGSSGGSKKTRKKASTGKKVKIVKRTAFFAFYDHAGKAIGEKADPIDLKAVPLKIKQLKKFIPPTGKDGKAADEAEVYLTLYEMKAPGSKERRHTEVFRLYGKVAKADGYNFRPAKEGKDVKLHQAPEEDAEAYFFKQAKWDAEDATTLVLKAKVEVESLDKKKTMVEFVLPPMEVDEMLELQFGGAYKEGSAWKAYPKFAVGKAKAKFGSFESDCSFTVTDTSEVKVGATVKKVPRGGWQSAKGGNLEKVVLHCMNAYDASWLRDANQSSKAYDVTENARLLIAGDVSAHFIIGRDGAVHQLVDVQRRAHHAYGANQKSLGIELIGFADDHRKNALKKYNKKRTAWEKKQEGPKKIKDTLVKALEKRQGQKAAGEKSVTIGSGKSKETMTIDQAIERIEAAIKVQDKKIEEIKLDAWAVDFGDNLLNKKESHKIVEEGPKAEFDAFYYTEPQYKALGELLKVIGKRFGYDYVLSHRRVSPARKYDPGVHFDWEQIEKALLPGSLSDDEKTASGASHAKGGRWNVS